MTITFSRAQLLDIKKSSCRGISRTLRRRLFFHRILNKAHKCAHVPCQYEYSTKERAIPVRISQRRKSSIPKKAAERRILVPVNKVLKQRLPKTRFSRRQPSILYTNVRSLFNKMDEIILNLNKYTPDVAVFCETWLDDSIPDVAISCNNYNVIRKDRNKYGGGIACYVNESFSPSVLTHFDIPSLNDCGSEFLPIMLPNLLLIAIYHPFWNCPKEHEAAISCLLDIIDFSLSSSLDSSDLRIVIIGDLNDLRHYTNDIEQLTRTKAIVDFPTRCKNVLDQFFTNIDNFVPPQRLSPVGKSDHALIMWTSKTKSSVCEKRTFRNITNYNKAKFCESIHQYDWLSLVSSVTSIDDAASLFQSCLLALFDLCFPKRTIRIRWSDPPWVKPSFKRLIDDRDRAYKKRKLTKYYRLREEVIRHGRHLKSVYIRAAISTRNSKAIWNAVKSVGGLTKNNVKTGFSAQEFADYFFSIYTKHPPVTATLIRDSDLMSPPVEVTVSEVSYGVYGRKVHVQMGSHIGYIGIFHIFYLNPSSIFSTKA